MQEEKNVLWKEGLRSFAENSLAWLRLAVPFMIVFAFLGMAMPNDVDVWHRAFMQANVEFAGKAPQGSQEASANSADKAETMNAESPLVEEEMAGSGQQAAASIVPHHAGPLYFVAWLALMVVSLLQSYVFTLFFMGRESFDPPLTLKPSVSNGLYYIGQIFLAMLKGMLPILGAGLLCVPVFWAFKGAVAGIIAFLLGSAGLAAGVYVYLGYMLVQPLAAADVAASLEVSWAMMRGQRWRVTRSWGMLCLVFFGISMVSQMVGYFVMWEVAFSEVGVKVVSILMEILGVLTSGMVCAFVCSTCRVLKQEAKALPQ